MKILAHRGYWKTKKEQNTLIAFARAVENGFGIETDFRDRQSRLVIAHDMPRHNVLPASKAVRIFSRIPAGQYLAVNVKSAGIAGLLKDFLCRIPSVRYFTFDAAVPDLFSYVLRDINSFIRLSEYEKDLSLLKKAQGVWLDAFLGEWYNFSVIEKLLSRRKLVAVVSPELHGREYQNLWKMLKAYRKHPHYSRLLLCTDLPMEAREFFQ